MALSWRIIAAIVAIVMFLTVLGKAAPQWYLILTPLSIILALSYFLYKGGISWSVSSMKRKIQLLLLFLVGGLLLIMIIGYSAAYLGRYHDYTQKVVPWCRERELEPFFSPFIGMNRGHTYPLYGCQDEGGNSIEVQYPFSPVVAEENLQILRSALAGNKE